VISGGQTGVDRAALDVALDLGLACGGWVPRGRRAEDGPVPAHYPLKEATSPAYADRTRLNVRDSDATLIVTRGTPTGGTALTVACARQLGRPVFIADLDEGADAEAVRAWLEHHQVSVLNVAGPRDSSAPGIYDDAVGFLRGLLEQG
jgi:predicted Rossmann-fold nucleotide-binding protein